MSRGRSIPISLFTFMMPSILNITPNLSVRAPTLATSSKTLSTSFPSLIIYTTSDMIHSYYRCFSSSDTSQSSDSIIQGVIDDTTGFWDSVAGWSKGHIICGEWSAALAPNSLEQSSRSQNSSRGYFAYVQLAMFK